MKAQKKLITEVIQSTFMVAVMIIGVAILTSALTGCRDNAVNPKPDPSSMNNTITSLSKSVYGYPGKSDTVKFMSTNLVANVSGYGTSKLDPNLVNGWGIVPTEGGNFWVVENGSGMVEMFDGQGNTRGQSFIVPAVGGGTGGSPSGIVKNKTEAFWIPGTHQRSRLIVVTEDGLITAWSNGSMAVIAADHSTDATAFKGVAIARVGKSHWLYATDLHHAKVVVFDDKFQFVTDQLFVDPTIPAGFAPFNIFKFHDMLVVTYAMQKAPDNHDDQKGPGFGYVDLFTVKGIFVKRLVSQGVLNAPWGLAEVHENLGVLSHALLVSNFGDGTINAFDMNGNLLGQLSDTSGTPIMISGLWGITTADEDDFGNSGSQAVLNFTAGPNDENDGVFGKIAAVNFHFVSHTMKTE